MTGEPGGLGSLKDVPSLIIALFAFAEGNSGLSCPAAGELLRDVDGLMPGMGGTGGKGCSYVKECTDGACLSPGCGGCIDSGVGLGGRP